MIRIIHIVLITLLFNTQVLAESGWASLFTGMLEEFNDQMDKQQVTKSIKGSKYDYIVLREFAGCINYVEKQSKYAHLNQKSPMPRTMGFVQLNDNTYANEYEKDLVAAYITEAEECMSRANVNRISNKSTKYIYLLSESTWADTVYDFSQLHSGSITWGELNNRIKNRSNYIAKKYNEWEMEIDAKIAESYSRIESNRASITRQRIQSKENMLNSLRAKRNRCGTVSVYSYDSSSYSNYDYCN